MSFLALALSLLLAQPVHAACDSKALKARMASASQSEAPAVFLELAACDPKVALEQANGAFQKIYPSAEGEKAAIAALKVGAGEVVRAWITRQISDERARTINSLGEQCRANPNIMSFFVESQKALGDQFWRERWHRGLAACREAPIQELLRSALLAPNPDSSRFGSILEVYARNLGKGAFPLLEQLATTSSPENQLHVMSAFSDAAGVGSENGTDPEAAREAIATIVKVAPKITTRAVEQARIAVESLGDPTTADQLAAVRYAALKQADGSFLWGAITIETVKCKNEKTTIAAHAGVVIEPGHRWPDQMQAATEQLVKKSWELDTAESCKGTGTLSVVIPPEPFADMKAFETWRDPQLKEIARRPADKHSEKIEKNALTLP